MTQNNNGPQTGAETAPKSTETVTANQPSLDLLKVRIQLEQKNKENTETLDHNEVPLKQQEKLVGAGVRSKILIMKLMEKGFITEENISQYQTLEEFIRLLTKPEVQAVIEKGGIEEKAQEELKLLANPTSSLNAFWESTWPGIMLGAQKWHKELQVSEEGKKSDEEKTWLDKAGETVAGFYDEHRLLCNTAGLALLGYGLYRLFKSNEDKTEKGLMDSVSSSWGIGLGVAGVLGVGLYFGWDKIKSLWGEATKLLDIAKGLKDNPGETGDKIMAEYAKVEIKPEHEEYERKFFKIFKKPGEKNGEKEGIKISPLAFAYLGKIKYDDFRKIQSSDRISSAIYASLNIADNSNQKSILQGYIAAHGANLNRIFKTLEKKGLIDPNNFAGKKVDDALKVILKKINDGEITEMDVYYDSLGTIDQIWNKTKEEARKMSDALIGAFSGAQVTIEIEDGTKITTSYENVIELYKKDKIGMLEFLSATHEAAKKKGYLIVVKDGLINVLSQTGKSIYQSTSETISEGWAALMEGDAEQFAYVYLVSATPLMIFGAIGGAAYSSNTLNLIRKVVGLKAVEGGKAAGAARWGGRALFFPVYVTKTGVKIGVKALTRTPFYIKHGMEAMHIKSANFYRKMQALKNSRMVLNEEAKNIHNDLYKLYVAYREKSYYSKMSNKSRILGKKGRELFDALHHEIDPLEARYKDEYGNLLKAIKKIAKMEDFKAARSIMKRRRLIMALGESTELKDIFTDAVFAEKLKNRAFLKQLDALIKAHKKLTPTKLAEKITESLPNLDQLVAAAQNRSAVTDRVVRRAARGWRTQFADNPRALSLIDDIEANPTLAKWLKKGNTKLIQKILESQDAEAFMKAIGQNDDLAELFFRRMHPDVLTKILKTEHPEVIIRILGSNSDKAKSLRALFESKKILQRPKFFKLLPEIASFDELLDSSMMKQFIKAAEELSSTNWEKITTKMSEWIKIVKSQLPRTPEFIRWLRHRKPIAALKQVAKTKINAETGMRILSKSAEMGQRTVGALAQRAMPKFAQMAEQIKALRQLTPEKLDELSRVSNARSVQKILQRMNIIINEDVAKAIAKASESKTVLKTIAMATKTGKVLVVLKTIGRAIPVAGVAFGIAMGGVDILTGYTQENDQIGNIYKIKGSISASLSGAELALLIAAGTAATGAAATAGAVLGGALPAVFYMGEAGVESWIENERGVEDWERDFDRETLIHHWISTGHMTAGDSYYEFVGGSRNYKLTSENIVKAIMKKEGMHIPAWPAEDVFRISYIEKTNGLTMVKPNYERAEELLQESALYAELMHQRSQAMGKVDKVMIGDFNIMDPKYGLKGEGQSMKELVDYYKTNQIEELEQPLLSRLDQFSTAYLLERYIELSREIGKVGGKVSQNINDFENVNTADYNLCLQIKRYLFLKRKVNADEALKDDFKKFYVEGLANGRGFKNEEEARMAYFNESDLGIVKTGVVTLLDEEKTRQEIEKNEIDDTAACYALYKLAEYFGYTGYQRESRLKQFFTEEKKITFGVYWDGDEWTLNEAGNEFDDDMGDNLNEQTVRNIIYRMREQPDNILEHRGEAMAWGLSDIYSEQVKTMAQILEKALVNYEPQKEEAPSPEREPELVAAA